MHPSDETLIAQTLQLQDTAAFGVLVQRYQSRILLLQHRLTGERALAEDLAQETFLKAWQKLDTFRGTGSFPGWLARLSYNLFLAHHRRHRRRKNEVELNEGALPGVAADEPGLADLDRLLGVLSREDQTIMVLSYAYELSNTEVGEVLGMPPGTIKARIHRAKARIRRQFDSADTQLPVPVGEPGTDAAGQDGDGRTTAPSVTRARPALKIFDPLRGAELS